MNVFGCKRCLPKPALLLSLLLALSLALVGCTDGAGTPSTTGIAGGATSEAATTVPDQILFSLESSEGFDAYSARTVSWRTPHAMTRSSVYLATGTPAATDTAAWERALEIAGTMTPEAQLPNNYGTFNHFEAQMTGLESGTYSYRVGAAGGITADTASAPLPLIIRSAQEAEQRATFLYFGDTQPEASIEEYALFGELVQTARTAYPQADLALQCGDLGNIGDSREEWAALLAAAQPAFAGMPLLTAPGNHEVSPYVKTPDRKPAYYLSVFALPKNGPEGFEEEYYSFDYGEAHIVSLSSNYLDPAESYSDDATESARLAQKVDTWLEADLLATDKPWKLVLMHQPAYPLVGDSTNTAMRERWIPLFNRTGVDVVLCGHQHEFMRSWPLLGDEEAPDGLVQIMGNASQKHYETSTSTLPFVAFEMGGIAGWHTITVTPQELTIEAFDSTARQLDYWTKQA